MKLFFLAVCLLLIACIGAFMPNQYGPSQGEQLVNQTLAKAAKIIKKKYQLQPVGEGAAMPGGPIQELTLEFDANARYTKEQLRDLLIKSAKELLEQIQTNEEIQPFLITKPFTIQNVKITIYNQDQNGREVYDPEISTASLSRGILIYKTTDPEDEFKYKNRIKETYEEALQALKCQNN